ncbi:MAG: helix-turn-helix domain-containing protein [Planctomycetota bacterium]
MSAAPTYGAEWYAGSHLPMQVVDMRPQPDSELHRHEFVELVLICAGTGRHLLDRRGFTVGPGDVFVIPPGMVHGYDRTRGLEIINILYEPNLLPLPRWDLAAVPGFHALFAVEPRLREEHGFQARLHLDARDQHRILRLVDGMRRELRAEAPGCAFAGAAWLMQIIVELARAYSAEQSPQARNVYGLAEVLTAMERDLAHPFTVHELAAIAHVSVSSLQRLFRRALDATPVEHLNRLRIRRACDLLRDPRRSVGEVARTVGIADSNYFARLFRREMTCSPRGFRRSLQQEL